MDIAVDVARGLAFLHSSEPNVIYRDLKASNILLDSVSDFFFPLSMERKSLLKILISLSVFPLKEFNAKLSDFGLAREGPTGDKTHVSTRVMGTRGYAAPEYVATGWQNSFFSSFNVSQIDEVKPNI